MSSNLLVGITCLVAIAQTASAASIAVLNYSPGEFQGFGASVHTGGPANESTGPFTFMNIDGSGVALTVSASAPAITEFAGNSTFPAAGFHMGDAFTSTFAWQLGSGYAVNWIEFDFRYLSDQAGHEERLSGFSATGASIINASLNNASGVIWNGSEIDSSIGDGTGTFRMECDSGATAFGWSYDLVSGDPQGATITEMRLGLVQVPEPSVVVILSLGVGSVFLASRRASMRRQSGSGLFIFIILSKPGVAEFEKQDMNKE